MPDFLHRVPFYMDMLKRDMAFQKKCLQRMNSFRKKGATIVLVTHSMADLGGFCDRVIQLDDGRVVRDGPTEEVIREYIEQMRSGDSHAGTPFEKDNIAHRERTSEPKFKKFVTAMEMG
ncbi:MAG: hypothetical protein ACU83O_13545, partial [Gammaproteobacteria bacterium]